MEKVLLDTDVLLDFFFDRKPFSDYAGTVINGCAKKQIKGYITPVIASNVYYLLRKTANHNTVIDKMKQLLSFIDIIKMDKHAVLNALNSDFKDFEDALQNFSAIETGQITVILTRNLKGFKKSTLAILTPESYLARSGSD